jgi:hypothetical protein
MSTGPVEWMTSAIAAPLDKVAQLQEASPTSTAHIQASCMCATPCAALRGKGSSSLAQLEGPTDSVGCAFLLHVPSLDTPDAFLAVSVAGDTEANPSSSDRNILALVLERRLALPDSLRPCSVYNLWFHSLRKNEPSPALAQIRNSFIRGSDFLIQIVWKSWHSVRMPELLEAMSTVRESC